MSYRILLLSSMYEGNIETFYRKIRNAEGMSYHDHYSLLRNNTTEFCGSYTRGFSMLGHETAFISANDSVLQKKWISEYAGNDSNDLLIRQVEAFRPEILWIDNLGLVDVHWIEEAKRKIPSIRLVAGYHCSPYNKKIIDNLKATDIALTCTPGLKADFINLGINTHLVYHGFDNTLNGTLQESEFNDEDVVFSGSLITGSKFHNDRIRFIKYLLDNDIDISLYVNLETRKRIFAKNSIFQLRRLLSITGAQKVIQMFPFFEYGAVKPESYSGKLLSSAKGPVYGQDMYSLFRKSRIVLNMHVGIAGQYAGNMRMFEATGCGSCLLTDNKQNISDLFVPDEQIVTYNTPEECAIKAKWLIKNDDLRRQIANAGQKRTLSEHTVIKRCEQIISIFNEEINNKCS